MTGSHRAASRLRDDARAIFRAALAAADPAAAVKRALRRGPQGGIEIAGREIRGRGALRAVAFGKAAVSMARAAAEALPEGLLRPGGILAMNDENAAGVPGFLTFPAGHPLPDERGERAAAEVEKYLSGMKPGDGLLVLISGGGSALLPAPWPGVSLEEKISATDLLLRGGADIHELNSVRKHLSRLKGGRLAALAGPAPVESLILSDVPGDDLSVIASGPTSPDPTTFRSALEALERRGAWAEAPAGIREHISRGVRGELPETPKPGDAIFERVRNHIVGSGGSSLEAARAKAESLGYAAAVASGSLRGEAREAAERLLARCREVMRLERKGDLASALVSGGETTVTVRGSGLGGRNQELALAFALEATRLGLPEGWALLSAGTDGRDGPTDAAGAIVDAGTIERGQRAGLDAARCLEDNDSYRFLEASGDLLRTGATGTNVADIQIILFQ
jgi:hydroxypyruvate reductase